MERRHGKIHLQVVLAIGLCFLPAANIMPQEEGATVEVPQCVFVSPTHHGKSEVFEIGKIWSGVRTMIEAAEPGDGKLLVAYYDAERWVTVASADAATGKVCKVRLVSRFSGWDGHNSLALAVAADGSLHVAGNAHASPLFYAWAPAADLATMRVTSMVGRNEDKATYPAFHKDAKGRLIFFYRAGDSGDGAWIADRWSGSGWARLGSSFASMDQVGSHLSAYPSPIVMDQRGTSHLAIVWRRSPDVATNYAVGYAKSADFETWSGAHGKPVKGPVGPDQIDVVDHPGENSGLLNNAKLLLTSGDSPVIFYTRYGARGTDALVAARRAATGWVVKEIATSDHRTPIAGEGSLPGAPVFAVTSNGDIGQVSVTFPRGPQLSFQIDLRTLEILRPAAIPRSAPAAVPSSKAPAVSPSIQIPTGLANASVWHQPVTASGFDGHSKSQLYWYAQGLNRDHAWLCTVRYPLACAPPPSPLLWVLPEGH